MLAGELPCRVGAKVVEGRSVDGDRPHPRYSGRPWRHATTSSISGVATAAQRRGQWVGAQVDRHRCAVLGVRPGRPAPAWRQQAPEYAAPASRMTGASSGTRPQAAPRVGPGATPESPTRISSALTPSPSAASTAAFASAAAAPGAGERLDDLPAGLDVA